ncbi:uncharacterized protein LOC132718290 isoform X1 [Ruditapes philippinarum]|uniref:uncharacterized protein LOC132718290 isoform X1 n=1 Tax=Ruditapes philippinarum TaxID=129788 RepID=UPI00295B8394|nr:uncharacterized protein LOC132718290 isoform X1 [Ruditapes philippinarum]
MAKMADIIVLIIVFWIYIYKGAAFITPYKTTWVNAISNCTIETPTIMFKGTETDLSVAVNASIIGNKDVWVGYYLAATAFHYVGCIKRGNMAATAEFKYNTPGLCYSACNMTYIIGVSVSKCYCFNNTIPPNRTYQLCTQGCQKQMNIACGGNNYISIYTPDSNANRFSGSGRCLQYELKHNTSTLMWADCASRNQIICRFNDTIHEIYDDDDDDNIKARWWRPSMNECFKLSKLPTSVKDLEKFERKSNRGKSWTGVISSDVIYISDHGATKITKKMFGYLKINKAKETVLTFDKDSTRQRYTLCQDDKTTQTVTFKTTSEKLISMTSNKQTTESPTRPDDDQSSPITNHNSLKTTTSGKIIQSQTDQASSTKASDIGIAVGVSVATLIIVVIVLVGVILTRR